MIRRLARHLLTPWLWNYSSAEIGMGAVTWSQFGEDVLLKDIFRERAQGTYVDVGACHPIFLSNTYALYRQGWRGVAIDANASMCEAFAKFRPNDRFIHSAVGKEGVVTMTMFDNAVFNCTEEHAASVPIEFRKGARSVAVPSKSLAAILDESQVGGVDFLNIDCEGSDLQILESNDWSRWSPEVICVEEHGKNWLQSDLSRFLAGKGYHLQHRLGPSSIFRR